MIAACKMANAHDFIETLPHVRENDMINKWGLGGADFIECVILFISRIGYGKK